MQVFTKQSLIKALKKISAMGFITNGRPGNDGGVGNTLEDFLQITENNLSIADWGEHEIKAQRGSTSSLLTLFHFDPYPRAEKGSPVQWLLVDKYGWPHKTKPGEKSFRATLRSTFSDRGFRIVVDRAQEKVKLSFDAHKVSDRHRDWKENLEQTVGLAELNPQPYWEFSDLQEKASNKLRNLVFVLADNKRGDDGLERFHYKECLLLENFNFNKFLEAIENNTVFVDFDARTGHNHGTKFRTRIADLTSLYEYSEDIPL